MKTNYHYHYRWQKSYFDAVSNSSAASVHSRIALARAAIDERIAEILTAKGNNTERQAIVDALFSLRFPELHSRNLIRIVALRKAQTAGEKPEPNCVPLKDSTEVTILDAC